MSVIASFCIMKLRKGNGICERKTVLLIIELNRVDCMDEVQIESEPVSEKAIIPNDDIAEYTNQMFKMYNGPAVDITIEFMDKLIGVIQDKFGEDTKIIRTGADRCVASIKVQVSPIFWG